MSPSLFRSALSRERLLLSLLDIFAFIGRSVRSRRRRRVAVGGGISQGRFDTHVAPSREIHVEFFSIVFCAHGRTAICQIYLYLFRHEIVFSDRTIRSLVSRTSRQPFKFYSPAFRFPFLSWKFAREVHAPEKNLSRATRDATRRDSTREMRTHIRIHTRVSVRT